MSTTNENRAVVLPRSCSASPADPACMRAWNKRGVSLGLAARYVVENDDVRAVLDDDAMPVSVALLALIYDVPDSVALNAVRHWLRRPNSD